MGQRPTMEHYRRDFIGNRRETSNLSIQLDDQQNVTSRNTESSVNIKRK